MKKPKTIDELSKMKYSGKPYWGPFLRPKEKVILVAAPKLGKTLFGMQLAASLACGIDFLDLKTCQTKVMYLNLEMAEEMIYTRINDIADSIRAPYDVLKKNLFVISDSKLRLDSKSYRDYVIKEVKNTYTKIIFLDPLQMAMKGSDSNEKDLKQFIKGVDKIIRDTGVSFFIIHHTPKVIKAKDPVYAPRGHSILSGWADAILHLYKGKLIAKARASDIEPIKTSLKYPKWYAGKWKTEVERVQVEMKSILEKSPRKKKARIKLQRLVKSSEWAFKEALKRLQEQGMIKIKPMKGNQYNQKIIVLV